MSSFSAVGDILISFTYLWSDDVEDRHGRSHGGKLLGSLGRRICWIEYIAKIAEVSCVRYLPLVVVVQSLVSLEEWVIGEGITANQSITFVLWILSLVSTIKTVAKLDRGRRKGRVGHLSGNWTALPTIQCVDRTVDYCGCLDLSSRVRP